MAKPKRRPKPKIAKDRMVVARGDIVARTACDVPLLPYIPASYRIEKGTIGLVVGPAPGAPELTIVNFDRGPGERLARVEVHPRNIEECV